MELAIAVVLLAGAVVGLVAALLKLLRERRRNNH